MELIQHRIPHNVREVVVAPLGDIQWAGKKEQIAFDHLKRHIDRCLKAGAWFLGTGDYIDFASPSNRQRLKSAALYDTAEAIIEDKALELTFQVYEELLKPTKGRWLGMLEGHHFATLSAGDTTDHRLCQMLDATFLGTTAYVQLAFDTHDGTRTVTLWASHGAGGGAKAHAPLMKLENLLPYWDADVFIVGHMTKVAAAPVKRLYANFGSRVPVLKERTIHLVGAGGWLKGYAEGSKVGRYARGGYVEQRMLNPVALGAPIIRIRPNYYWLESNRQTRKRGAPSSRAWAPQVTVEV